MVGRLNLSQSFLPKHFIHRPHGSCTFLKGFLLGGGQFKWKDFLPAILSNGNRYTQANVRLTIFAFQGNATSEEFFLVSQNA
jgi:hypothetical protein